LQLADINIQAIAPREKIWGTKFNDFIITTRKSTPLIHRSVIGIEKKEKHVYQTRKIG